MGLAAFNRLRRQQSEEVADTEPKPAKSEKPAKPEKAAKPAKSEKQG